MHGRLDDLTVLSSITACIVALSHRTYGLFVQPQGTENIIHITEKKRKKKQKKTVTCTPGSASGAER